MNIYIDLDRTLLDTDRFVRKIWDWIAENHSLNSQEEQKRAKEFLIFKSDMYTYGFFNHVRRVITFREEEFERFKLELLLHMQKEDFLFPKTTEAIKILEKIGFCGILTFGEKEYQQFKIDCCKTLKSIPATVIQEPKGTYFKKLLSGGGKCYLIDDKPVYAELPEFVSFIQIDAKQNENVLQRESYVVAKNLYEAALYLQEKEGKHEV